MKEKETKDEVVKNEVITEEVPETSEPVKEGEEAKEETEEEKKIKEEIALREKTVQELIKQYPNIANYMVAVLNDQLFLFAKKHLDYGLANITGGTELKTPAEVDFAIKGLWYRVSDKVNRWKNIMITGETHNENIMDTFQDIANYAMIAQLVARGLWHE